MDKASERKADSKKQGDCDIGVHDYKAGGKIERMAGLWSIAGKEVVGLGPDRLMSNEYCKKPDEKGEGSASDLMEEILTSGPPILNISAPKRIL